MYWLYMNIWIYMLIKSWLDFPGAKISTRKKSFNQDVEEHRGFFAAHVTGKGFDPMNWLVLDALLLYFTTEKISFGLPPKPWSPSLFRVKSRWEGWHCFFFCFALKRGGDKRELWVMEDLSANLKKTVDNETSLLPKTQSSAWEKHGYQRGEAQWLQTI